jgi:hypothetical protein
MEGIMESNMIFENTVNKERFISNLKNVKEYAGL